jgi:hypothetical protein
MTTITESLRSGRCKLRVTGRRAQAVAIQGRGGVRVAPTLLGTKA